MKIRKEYRRTVRMLLIAGGGAAVLAGMSIMIHGRIPESAVMYYGEERYWRAGLGIAGSIPFLVMGWLMKTEPMEGEAMVCPNCGTPFMEIDVVNRTCPDCSVKLEAMEGFYGRHPEFDGDD